MPLFDERPDTAFRSLRKIDGERVETKPRGRTTIITTMARPNSRPRYCAGSKSGMREHVEHRVGQELKRPQREDGDDQHDRDLRGELARSDDPER